MNLDPAEHERVGQIAAQYERLTFEDILGCVICGCGCGCALGG
ncbi:hypothetical protein [Embleya scabrispora]|nr:hypothetical protein [Embleya scabrispora]